MKLCMSHAWSPHVSPHVAALLLQVYLGKWHGSEVAVKCLNPGLFFGGGEANNHAAVNELVKEADMLGRYGFFCC